MTIVLSPFAGGAEGRRNVAEALRSCAKDGRSPVLLLEESLSREAAPAPPLAVTPCPLFPEPN